MGWWKWAAVVMGILECVVAVSDREGSVRVRCAPRHLRFNDACFVVDFDECTLGTHSCSKYATCTDTQSSFTCACMSGFIGDGLGCRDIGALRRCLTSGAHSGQMSAGARRTAATP